MGKIAERINQSSLPVKLDIEKIYNKISKKGSINLLSAIPAILLGGFSKSTLLKLNRISTKQYKPQIDKNSMSEEEIKEIKKQTKRERKNANFRNSVSGMINGLTLPLVGILGVAGVPFYIAINAVNKFFIAKKENKGQRNLKGFVQDVKNSPITYALSALAIGIPLAKKGNYSTVLEKNIQEITQKIKSANLEQPQGTKTAYKQLEDILFEDKEIESVLFNDTMSIEEKISALKEKKYFLFKI